MSPRSNDWMVSNMPGLAQFHSATRELGDVVLENGGESGNHRPLNLL